MSLLISSLTISEISFFFFLAIRATKSRFSGSSNTAPSSSVNCCTVVEPSSLWMVTVCPLLYSRQYFPRTPVLPEKSYSGFISDTMGVFLSERFIGSLLLGSSLARTDYADICSSFRMNYQQQCMFYRKTDADGSMFFH